MQKLLVYALSHRKRSLYYWHKKSCLYQAEINYLIQLYEKILPVKVNAETGRPLQSLQHFLTTHSHCLYGLQFSKKIILIFKILSPNHCMQLHE